MANAITLSTTVSRSEEQVHTEIEDECIILNLGNSVYYGLDPVGTFIWNQLTAATPVSKLVRKVLDEFDVDRSECETDVIALLADLEKEGLVETGIT